MNDYNFKRLSREGEKTWDDVIQRFIREMVKRGAKTPREDMEWLLLNYYALPNSPALLTAGDEKFYASACSSFPIFDTMEGHPFSILNILKLAATTTKAGIGTGFNFSQLRSKEEKVRGRNNCTGGPVSFLRAYNNFLREITQATRKSASLGSLSVSHPDIIDFIDCKKDDGTIECFNLSILINDEFMEAAVNDREFALKYITTDAVKKIRAKELLDLMCLRAWERGEPCFIFSDNIRRDYFINIEENQVLNNPCQESLLSYGDDYLELCVLASINLPKYTELPINNRKRVVDILVRVLNDIIDVQDYVTPYHKRGMQDISRKIGIGVAGLATVLACKRIKYFSTESYSFTKDMYRELGDFSIESSARLGNILGLGRYNSLLLSQAPTSTLSNIMNDINEQGASYGCEPFFSLENQIIKNGYGDFEYKDKIIDFLKGETSHIECANELSYEGHLSIVKAFYDANKDRKISHSLSKTINFKNNVSPEDIKKSLIECWKSGVKGISFYRDGSRKNQVINIKGNSCNPEERPSRIIRTSAPKRPESVPCEIHHIQSNKQPWIVMVGMLDDYPYEVFFGSEEKIQLPRKYDKGIVAKEGHKYNLIVGEGDDALVVRDIVNHFEAKEFSTLTRLISLCLRHGCSIEFLVEQLLRDGAMDALNKGVARILKKSIKDEVDARVYCPQCKKRLFYVQGCPTCICGYSRCN